MTLHRIEKGPLVDTRGYDIKTGFRVDENGPEVPDDLFTQCPMRKGALVRVNRYCRSGCEHFHSMGVLNNNCPWNKVVLSCADIQDLMV